MGRLQKSKVDEIIQLRMDGNTQMETAEKAGVNLKTVQKYDPLRKSKKSVRPHMQLSADLLEYYLKCLGDWVDSIITTLRFGVNTELTCPACMHGKLVFDEEVEMYICKECKYEMPLPSYVWEEDQNNSDSE